MNYLHSAWRTAVRSLLVVFFALAVQITMYGSAVQARPLSGIGPNCGGGEQATYCSELLSLHGGSVQHDPVVYLIFWGTKWSTDSSGVVNAMENLFSSLAGSAFNNVLVQYGDGSGANGYVHNDAQLGGYFIDTATPVPPNVVDASSFDYEIHHIEWTKGWTSSPNTQFIIFPQQGAPITSFWDGACGMHQYDQNYQTAWAWVRYASDPASTNGSGSCMSASDISGSMMTAALHEYAEAATDPTGPGIITGLQQWGWATTDPKDNPIEAGDKCQGYNAHPNIDAYVNGTDVPYLWDMSTSSCVLNLGQDISSSAGVHTVYGNMLTTYDNNGGTQGNPTEEATPLAGGFVQHFDGHPCATSGSNDQGSAIYTDGPVLTTTAYAVQGCIYNKYVSEGNASGFLGFPVSNEIALSGGYASYFGKTPCGTAGPYGSSGGIFDSGSGAHEVHGCIYSKYAQFGTASGGLKFPVTDEMGVYSGSTQVGRVSYFSGNGSGGPYGSGSAIYYSSSTGAHQIGGSLYYTYWSADGGPTGTLGFPSSDVTDIAGWYVSYFGGSPCIGAGPSNSAAALYSSSVGTHYVRGCIYHFYWNNMGGPSGVLGFPTADSDVQYVL